MKMKKETSKQKQKRNETRITKRNKKKIILLDFQNQTQIAFKLTN